ncbi:hypothetical protein QE429_002151 [Bacillus sp. SORGH_AS 510]|nr:hypothetical protein [Bacillus sp. SORGH_AS_0510]
MIISYVKLTLTMKIILIKVDKEGVTYGSCFCRRNNCSLRICHEARLTKCNSIISKDKLTVFKKPGRNPRLFFA